MSKVIDITGDNFDSEVLKSAQPVLVDFWAPWCGPCRMMAPVLDQLSEELADKLKIVKVNTELPGNQALAEKYEILSIPNMKLFKNGQVIQDYLGLRPKEYFKQELDVVL